MKEKTAQHYKAVSERVRSGNKLQEAHAIMCRVPE